MIGQIDMRQQFARKGKNPVVDRTRTRPKKRENEETVLLVSILDCDVIKKNKVLGYVETR